MSRLRNLFDADARKEVLERLDEITSDSKPSFGKMSVDQMLWHVNRTMSYAMGEYPIPYRGNKHIDRHFIQFGA